ncbi:MAG: response regulator [Deltaproteobacteria bacterium]|jgi:CheY-like chemotaxis protein|nr:response regulator [Deltaproteobacteria bacterium]MBW2530434.1 response regulator [Deltaproteobacteria bacterium]
MVESTLLIVDDSEMARNALAEVLRSHIREVLTAGNAEDALALLAERDVAVVVCDYLMPGMDGVEFLARVRSEFPSVIRILITGEGKLEVAIKAVNIGHVYKFFTKSVDDDDLVECIVNTCRYAKVIAGTEPQTKTILVADSSQLTSAVIEQVLWGKYRVISVSDGLGAIKAFDEQPIDLLVSALQLRYLNGVELIGLCKSKPGRSCPAILYTTDPADRGIAECGADAVVTKSTDLTELFETINGLLGPR